MALLSPHWEALTPATRQAFQVAGTLPFIHRYYLAGGTGLALQLGHRFSVDLDFFSPAPDAVGPDERSVMRTAFDDPALAISWDKDMTFVGIWRGVGVSFFCLALYPLVQEPLLLEGVPLATSSSVIWQFDPPNPIALTDALRGVAPALQASPRRLGIRRSGGCPKAGLSRSQFVVGGWTFA